jgi:PadR family transcriptional regulator PadR
VAGNKVLPNRREEAILRLLLSHEHYGREIRDVYEQRTTETMPLGSLYTTLDRMEEQGLIASRLGESTAERGGNRRKYFKIKGAGIFALDQIDERSRQMSLIGKRGAAHV